MGVGLGLQAGGEGEFELMARNSKETDKTLKVVDRK